MLQIILPLTVKRWVHLTSIWWVDFISKTKHAGECSFDAIKRTLCTESCLFPPILHVDYILLGAWWWLYKLDKFVMIFQYFYSAFANLSQSWCIIPKSHRNSDVVAKYWQIGFHIQYNADRLILLNFDSFILLWLKPFHFCYNYVSNSIVNSTIVGWLSSYGWSCTPNHSCEAHIHHNFPTELYCDIHVQFPYG